MQPLCKLLQLVFTWLLQFKQRHAESTGDRVFAECWISCACTILSTASTVQSTLALYESGLVTSDTGAQGLLPLPATSNNSNSTPVALSTSGPIASAAPTTLAGAATTATVGGGNDALSPTPACRRTAQMSNALRALTSIVVSNNNESMSQLESTLLVDSLLLNANALDAVVAVVQRTLDWQLQLAALQLIEALSSHASTNAQRQCAVEFWFRRPERLQIIMRTIVDAKRGAVASSSDKEQAGNGNKTRSALAILEWLSKWCVDDSRLAEILIRALWRAMDDVQPTNDANAHSIGVACALATIIYDLVDASAYAEQTQHGFVENVALLNTLALKRMAGMHRAEGLKINSSSKTASIIGTVVLVQRIVSMILRRRIVEHLPLELLASCLQMATESAPDLIDVQLGLLATCVHHCAVVVQQDGEVLDRVRQIIVRALPFVIEVCVLQTHPNNDGGLCVLTVREWLVWYGSCCRMSSKQPSAMHARQCCGGFSTAMWQATVVCGNTQRNCCSSMLTMRH
jgi:hypothetical protein